MLNSSIELDVILLEQFEDFFGIFQNEWTGMGNLFEFSIDGYGYCSIVAMGPGWLLLLSGS